MTYRDINPSLVNMLINRLYSDTKRETLHITEKCKHMRIQYEPGIAVLTTH